MSENETYLQLSSQSLEELHFEVKAYLKHKTLFVVHG
jgi:hypothetical protein